MFLLVEAYHREPRQAVGRIVATHAIADTQLAGTILRLIKTGGANQVIVTEISDEVFAEYYQEQTRRNAKQKDEQ